MLVGVVGQKQVPHATGVWTLVGRKGTELQWGGGDQDRAPQTAHNLPVGAPASWAPQPCGLPDVCQPGTESRCIPISLPLPGCVSERHVATAITQFCFLAPSAQP